MVSPREDLKLGMVKSNSAAHFITQSLHQSSVTAAEVDYATATFDMSHDEFICELHRQVGHLVAICDWHRIMMMSRTKKP